MGCVHCGSQPGEHPDWCRGNIPTVFERLLMERDAYRNALKDVLEVCNGYVGTGPIKTIVDISSTALNKIKEN